MQYVFRAILCVRLELFLCRFVPLMAPNSVDASEYLSNNAHSYTTCRNILQIFVRNLFLFVVHIALSSENSFWFCCFVLYVILISLLCLLFNVRLAHNQAERTIAIRKRKFLNKFCAIHNALCRVSLFVAVAETELESCCTDVQLSD